MWKTKIKRCIYTSPSGFKVYQNVFYRWLTFGSTAIQSIISRHHPHKPILSYLPMFTLMARHQPGSMCLLGLGGGAVALMMPDAAITAVEKNSEVIDIAQRFFLNKEQSKLNIVHDNAMNYVQDCTQTFSHLLIDLYDANNFPAECANTLFFNSCNKMLAEDGFLSINIANLKDHWPIIQLVKNQFPSTVIIPIKKRANIVIIAAKTQKIQNFLEQINQSGEIKRVMWTEWGYVAEAFS